MSLKTLPVTVFWSDEDNAFIAVGDLPGAKLSAFGKSRVKAVKELEVAMGLVADEQEDG